MKRIALFLLCAVALLCMNATELQAQERTIKYDAYTPQGSIEAAKDTFGYIFREAMGGRTPTREQLQAIDELVNAFAREEGAHVQKYRGQPISQMPTANSEHTAIIKKFSAKAKEISTWPNGKDPNAKPAAQERPKEPERPATPSPSSDKSPAEEKLANAQEAFPNNPHDNLDKIPGMNLTASQKTLIVQIQQTRKTEMVRAVTKMKSYRRTPDAARTVFRILKTIALLANYRIERGLTPTQIAALRKYQRDVPISVDRWEDLGLTENDVWVPSSGGTSSSLPQWNDGKPAEELSIRLSRCNFHDFEEFSRFLSLNDEQKHGLESCRAEYDAALEIAKEDYRDMSEPSRTDLNKILADFAERTGKIAGKSRDLIERNQMAKFDALSILLVDALEFPASNMASFEGMELSSPDKIKVQGALNEFALNEIDKLMKPNRVSASQQQSAQQTLENNIKSSLPGKALTAWNKAFSDNRVIYESVKKYKER